MSLTLPTLFTILNNLSIMRSVIFLLFLCCGLSAQNQYEIVQGQGKYQLIVTRPNGSSTTTYAMDSIAMRTTLNRIYLSESEAMATDMIQAQIHENNLAELQSALKNIKGQNVVEENQREVERKFPDRISIKQEEGKKNYDLVDKKIMLQGIQVGTLKALSRNALLLAWTTGQQVKLYSSQNNTSLYEGKSEKGKTIVLIFLE